MCYLCVTRCYHFTFWIILIDYRFKPIQTDSNRFKSIHAESPHRDIRFCRVSSPGHGSSATLGGGSSSPCFGPGQARRGSKRVPKGIQRDPKGIQNPVVNGDCSFGSPLRRRNNHFGQHQSIGDLHQGSGFFSGNFGSTDSFDLGCLDSSFCFLLCLSVFLLLCSGSSTCLQYFALRFSHVFFFSLFLLLCSFILACSPFSTECRSNPNDVTQ